jgi:hypothetical protein
MVKHNKNFKSKKKQSLKKKALRKTKRKGGKKSKKKIGGFGAFMKREMCEPRIARFNVTENDYENKTYKDTTSAIHGYISSKNFKELLHKFYHKKWKKAVQGDADARIYFGRPKLFGNLTYPTIKFAFDTNVSCDNQVESIETDAMGFFSKSADEHRSITKPMIIKIFTFDYNDQYEFATSINKIQPQPPKPILEQASEDNFLKNLEDYGFFQIEDRKRDSIEEKYCTIRLPSHIRSDSKNFRTVITNDLQKSDKNFLNNKWYVFYKHHSWDNSFFGNNNKYFQYGNPDNKISGSEFIDLLDSKWTQAINVDSTTLELQGATSREEKQRANERAYEKNNNTNNKVKEQNLVVKDFILVREFAQFLDSCKQ